MKNCSKALFTFLGNNMFNYRFNNGTGVRCWVAGYGKDKEKGDFSFIQRKVDVPLFSNRNECNNRLKSELSKKSPRTAANFQLSAGELCAGGEQGKDSCEGDGGAPLVCLFTFFTAVCLHLSALCLYIFLGLHVKN